MTDPRIEAAAKAIAEYVYERAGKPLKWEDMGDTRQDVAQDYASVGLAAADAAAWRPIESAPRDCVFLGLVDGHVRFVSYTKASHVRLYGFCLMDQGSEDLDICYPTRWQPIPAPLKSEVAS